jgi:hypothetical protein
MLTRGWELTVLQKVLDTDSSVLGYPGEISKPLDTDHNNICKFENRNDPSYITIRNVPKSVIIKVHAKGMSLITFYDITKS